MERIIEVKRVAWVPSAQNVRVGMFDGTPDNAFRQVCLVEESTNMKPSGWVEVGLATILFTPNSDLAVAGAAIAALRLEAEETRIQAVQRQTRIEEKIQSLLALEAPTEPRTAKYAEDGDDFPF